jgi:CspA family cold shock protein
MGGCALRVFRFLHLNLYWRAKMAQYRGTVKWFNHARGYGFLGQDEGPDVFCHYSAISKDGYKSLKEGEAVEFDVVEGGNGKPQANQVIRLNDPL